MQEGRIKRETNIGRMATVVAGCRKEVTGFGANGLTTVGEGGNGSEFRGDGTKGVTAFITEGSLEVFGEEGAGVEVE